MKIHDTFPNIHIFIRSISLMSCSLCNKYDEIHVNFIEDMASLILLVMLKENKKQRKN